MKTIVSLQDLVEQEIHPGPLLQEFRALTERDLRELFGGELVRVACPACAEAESETAFAKLGVTYERCRACGSVYASPRPSEDALAAYDREASASRFWRNNVLAATAGARREKLTRPRAAWVADTVTEHAPGTAAVLDLSPADGAFHEDLRAALANGAPPVVGDPRGRTWMAQGPFDIVTAFDTLDRIGDARALVSAVAEVLRPGGLLFVTAPTISGFDLQVLEDRASGILPPSKLNLLSIEGFGRLLGGACWRVIELSTPGMFDVENVRHAVLASPDADWPSVIRSLVLQPEEARREFQAYLQRHRLASFVRLVARRV